MFNIGLGLRVLGLTALLSVSASSQTPNSGSVQEGVNGQLSALNKKALAGDTKAQLRMGLAFEFGQGVAKDLDKAMHWYHIAADRGDPVAQTDLGKVIGKQGRTARSIRTILSAAGMKLKKRFTLEILE